MTKTKIDLHTHSERSHDGGLTIKDYKRAIENNLLDYIAITDHNEIEFAVKANSELGERIIIGEEIMTKSGEIIGLYLKDKINSGLELEETIKLIKAQDGLVYVPHPFETTRSGIQISELKKFLNHIDILEVYNGRAFFGKKIKESIEFAEANNIIGASSSDSHGWHGWGRTYTEINQSPKKDTLLQLLRESEQKYRKPSIRAILYPKYNKLRRVLP